MKHLFKEITNNERNRILEMHGFRKSLVVEQTTPPFNYREGRLIRLSLKDARGFHPQPNFLEIITVMPSGIRVKTPDGRELNMIFTNSTKTMLNGGTSLYRVDEVKDKTTTTPSTGEAPKPKPEYPPVNLFSEKDYRTTGERPIADQVQIIEEEEKRDKSFSPGRNVGSFIKLTTDNKIKEGKPLILYFICGYEGFVTNFDGYDIDDINVLIRKFEMDPAQWKVEQTPARERDSSVRDSMQLPKTKSPNLEPKPVVPRPLNIQTENYDKYRDWPLVVYSNDFHEILTKKYCTERQGNVYPKGLSSTGGNQSNQNIA